jgi:flavin reductase (DIM6/NTAB) family NADH-FMN oxidoreductase RutF
MGDRSREAPSNITGGGGIVFGDVSGGRASVSTSGSASMNAIRKRWASGVAVVTVVDADGGFRGVTATSFVVVSVNPPIVALALSSDGSFHRLFDTGTPFGVSLLDRSHTFLADRFGGRAPIPDTGFSGVPHVVHGSGVPVIRDAIGWCACLVTSQVPVGDHVLMLAELQDGGVIADTDDPLLSYGGRYRALEVG